MAILRIFRGHPGSGKTTAVKNMFPGIFHVENDMYLMHNGKYEWSKKSVKDAIDWCTNMVKTALMNDVDVVVSNTFTKRRYIEAYVKLAELTGASVEVYRCTGNYQNVHGLNDEMVRSFKKSMEDYPNEIII